MLGGDILRRNARIYKRKVGLIEAEDGFATDSLARLLVDLARGNLGLIITGQT